MGRNPPALLCVVLLVLCIGIPVGVSQSSDQSIGLRESDLHVAVIVGILRFTDWSKATNSVNNAEDITVCGWGDAPSIRSLSKPTLPLRVHDHQVKFFQVETDAELAACPVIIWGEKSDQQNINHLPPRTLVICDMCDFQRVDAAIRLIASDSKIEFDINLDYASSAGISFRSDLLELARKVDGI